MQLLPPWYPWRGKAGMGVTHSRSDPFPFPLMQYEKVRALVTTKRIDYETACV